MRRTLAMLLATLFLVAWILPRSVREGPRPPPRPNFVIILTDDQPVGTVREQPTVARLAARGVTFTNGIISNPLCCPSRTSILTGLYSHSDGVYTIENGSDGGYAGFADHKDGRRTFALALQRDGYQTGLFGKYLNHYDGSPQVGWSTMHAFVGSNGSYYNYAWTIDGRRPLYHGSTPADYSTNVAGSEADAWLQSLSPATPFLLYFAPFAPHNPVTPASKDIGKTPSTSFRTPAFNEADVSDKPGYIRALPRLTTSQAAKMAARWTTQYETLLSVDRWVATLQRTLADLGVAENTYIIYLSDNGQTWGDHRWTYKTVPYERSIRVPFVMSGPGIVPGRVDDVVSNIDIAPTILDLAEAPPLATDGLSLVPLLTRTGTLGRRGVLLEHKEYDSRHDVPAYCGFRTRGWMFARYVTGEEELYDLRRDPFELHNIAAVRPAKTASMRRHTYAAGCDTSIVPPA